MDDRTLPFRLTLFDFTPTEAAVTVREYDPGERTRRALKVGGVFLGIAILCVLIPIAHFVLVPGFLILAIVMAARRLGQRRQIVRVHGRCPRCATDQDFMIEKAPLEGDIELTCNQCRNRVRGSALAA